MAPNQGGHPLTAQHWTCRNDAAAHRGMAWAQLINDMVLKKPRTTLTCSRSWDMSRPAAATRGRRGASGGCSLAAASVVAAAESGSAHVDCCTSSPGSSRRWPGGQYRLTWRAQPVGTATGSWSKPEAQRWDSIGLEREWGRRRGKRKICRTVSTEVNTAGRAGS